MDRTAKIRNTNFTLARKSFVSTLVGIAIDKGYIDSVNRPVKDFFPGRVWSNPSADKDAMRLEDLLTMRSGLDWLEGDAAYTKMYMSRDWVKFVMDETEVHKPGTVFNYCSGCSHVLSAIVQSKTGMNTQDFAQKELFGPLGITALAWDADSQGLSIGGWGLQLTPRDMAKLGYLYLNGGIWDGRQIVSAQWVKTATQKHTGTDSELGYGYQWWTHPSLEGYAALGLYGQTIFVIPQVEPRHRDDGGGEQPRRDIQVDRELYRAGRGDTVKVVRNKNGTWRPRHWLKPTSMKPSTGFGNKPALRIRLNRPV